MFATALRLAAKKVIEPHVSPEEAHRLADILHQILKQHGPLNVESCWAHAKVNKMCSNQLHMDRQLIRNGLHIKATNQETPSQLKMAVTKTPLWPAGLRSKRHMKIMLKWMKERQRVRIICNPLKELCGPHGDKEFLYAPFYHKPNAKDADCASLNENVRK